MPLFKPTPISDQTESKYLKLADVEGQPMRLLGIDRDEEIDFDDGSARALTVEVQRLAYTHDGALVPNGPSKYLGFTAKVPVDDVSRHFAETGDPIDVVFRRKTAKKSGFTFWDVDPTDGRTTGDLPF